ncbi:MAG: hydrogen peroxide-inducible genes activator [Alphaproteobacteria bacterium]|nr:hydrogen peroxide-inducible genes activator [Alphaproteobacteria bacterium]
MSNNPTIKQLQYLQALAAEGSFQKAADKCFVSQSTLSAGIKEMENLLGLPVIDRQSRKKLNFTSFGEEVLNTSKVILSQIDNLTARAQNLSAPLSGPFRLGIIPTIAPYLIPNILPALQKEFPKMEFHIVEDLTTHLIEKVEDGDVDLAVLAFPYETPYLRQQVLYDEAFYVAAPKGLFEKNKKLSMSDLEDHPLLLLEDGHCLRDHALSACKLVPDKNKKTLSATSLLTLIQMVAQGNGITLLPEMVIKEGFLPKNIDLVEFKKPLPTRQIGLCWQEKSMRRDSVQAVLQNLKGTLQ